MKNPLPKKNKNILFAALTIFFQHPPSLLSGDILFIKTRKKTLLMPPVSSLLQLPS